MNGFFITFEGVEGAGKTTQVRLFVDYLEQHGYDYVVTREPGGTGISDQIRALLLDPSNTAMDPMTEVLLYAAARAQHVAELIEPSLEQGKIVVCDRFVDSSLAYQGYGRGIPLPLVQQINNIVLQGLEPNLTFLIDLEPQIGLPRAKGAGNDGTSGRGDRIERETLTFHKTIRSGYLAMADMNKNRIQVLDGRGSIPELHKKIVDLFISQYGR